MAGDRSFLKMISAIKSATVPEECAPAITGLLGAVTPEELDSFVRDGSGSNLGAIISDGDLFPVTSGTVTDFFDRVTIENLQKNINELPVRLRSELAEYFTDRFDPPARDDLVTLLHGIAGITAETMSLRLPCMMETAGKPEVATGLAELFSSAFDGIPGSDTGTLSSVWMRDMRHFPMIDRLFRQRLSLEREWAKSDREALLRAKSENRLINGYRRASSVPASISSPPARGDIPGLTDCPFTFRELRELLTGLSAIAESKGLLVLEERIDTIHEPFIRKGIRLIVDGTDPELVRHMLETGKKAALLGQEIRHDIAIFGAMKILEGSNPRIIDSARKDFSKPGAHPVSIQELSRSFAGMAEQARREGLLSLEDYLYPAGEDESNDAGETGAAPETQPDTSPTGVEMEEGEAIDVSILSELMRRGLELVIDGTDPELVRELSRFHGKHDIAMTRQVVDATIEGVLGIQCGNNPRMIEDIIDSHEPPGDPGTLIDIITGLSEKTRREGLRAIEGDLVGVDDRLLRFCLAMAVNNIGPDLLRELADGAARRLRAEYGHFHDLCIAGILFIQAGMDTNTLVGILDLLAPSADGTIYEHYIETMRDLRRAVRAGTAPPRTRDHGLMAFLSDQDARWNGFFDAHDTFRELLWRSSMLASVWHNDPVRDYIEELRKEIPATLKKAGSGKRLRRRVHSSLLPLLASAYRVTDKLLRDARACRDLVASIRGGALEPGEGATDDDGSIPALEIDLSRYDTNLASHLSHGEIRDIFKQLDAILAGSRSRLAGAVSRWCDRHGLAAPGDAITEVNYLNGVIAANESSFGFPLRFSLAMRYLSGAPGEYHSFTAPQLLLPGDFVHLDQHAIMVVLREVDTQDLAKAMVFMPAVARDAIYACMSPRAAELLREDIEFMGPVPPGDSAESFAKIMNILAHLVNRGHLALPEAIRADDSPDIQRVQALIGELMDEAAIAIRENLHGEKEAAARILDTIEGEKGVTFTRSISGYRDAFGGNFIDLLPREKRDVPTNLHGLLTRLSKAQADKSDDDANRIIEEIFDELEKRDTVRINRWCLPYTTENIEALVKRIPLDGEGSIARDEDALAGALMNSGMFHFNYLRPILARDLHGMLRTSAAFLTNDGLMRLDDMSFSKVMREIPDNAIITALSAEDAVPGITERILATLTPEKREMILEEAGLAVADAPSVEEAWTRIRTAAVQLAEAGMIIIPR